MQKTTVLDKIIRKLDDGSMDRIVEEYKTLLKSTEKTLLSLKENHPQHNKCVKGCCKCCNGIFEITLLDAMLLYKTAQNSSLTPEVYDIANEFSHFANSKSWNYPHFYHQIEELEEQIDLTEFDTKPCPLLDKNGLCKIYSFRPSICRFQGFKLKDPQTGFIMDDECTEMNPDRNALEFDIFAYDKTELDIFHKVCDVIPELENFDIAGWDTLISSVLLWKVK